jgi:hypothetical protein
MRKTLFIFPLILAMLFGCSPPKALVTGRESIFEISPGDFSSEITEKMVYHEQSGVFYKFEKDKDNLYLLLATSDPALQRKIAYFGMTVWIDRSGDRNKAQGFRFPVGTGHQAPVHPGSPGGSLPGVNSVLSRADEIELIGIYGSSSRIVKRRDSQIRVQAFMQEDMLVYKAVVPFGVLKHRLDPAGVKKMSVGIETGYYDISAYDRQSQGFEGRRSGGGMQHPGTRQGNMPGHVPAGAPGSERESENRSLNSLSKPARFWIELIFDPRAVL